MDLLGLFMIMLVYFIYVIVAVLCINYPTTLKYLRVYKNNLNNYLSSHKKYRLQEKRAI